MSDKYVLEIKIGSELKKRGLTQKDLAELTGIRPNAISNLVRGFVERITIDHLERIAKALEVDDINELLTLHIEESKEESAK
ncbi:helix-turn-helix transcriptional regulator [Gracilibacillus caseinilyticus]|uniref:Helix-turn-helix transcriptional regulator n=1 Tax=Gracilibacillus caseinilyticus TaxID=2932256 RepID=A0ABY4EV32_9BACI|nr:helix-turn-helix transcriptional regulator [Gracilibacillus caseinilyticus]UOQ48139.1 helix-turn-helix transcriptional regulator [Gracilibacillus caseinilyticus]